MRTVNNLYDICELSEKSEQFNRFLVLSAGAKTLIPYFRDALKILLSYPSHMGSFEYSHLKLALTPSGLGIFSNSWN